MSVTLRDDRSSDEEREPGIESDLSAFQQAILTILSEEARYGLAIKEELEEYYGKAINHGRLYPNLDELVEMGLVEKSELDKRTNGGRAEVFSGSGTDERDFTQAPKYISWTLE